jgi:hypothetical protein
MALSTVDSVRLPHVHAIGFAGGSDAGDETMWRGVIVELLKERQRIANRLMCGVCTVAAGSSLVFAESCIALEIPLRLLLPLPRERFLRPCSGPERGRFERVIDGALSVEVAGSEEFSEQRYYECGLQIVQVCQELFAVWDGKLEGGSGGVGEIVAFAGEMRTPVVWIHGGTPRFEMVHPRSKQNDGPERELSFLNGLPYAREGVDGDGPAALGELWLEKLDKNAARLAPQVRKMAAVPIVCTALAAFVSAAAQNRHAGSAVWIGAGAALGMAAGVLPAALSLGKQQALWVRIRTAAEVSRSMLAVWETPVRYRVVGPEILPELNSMIQSLDFLKAKAGQTSQVELTEFKKRYIQERLLGQKDYFSDKSAASAQMGGRFRRVSKVCSISAIVLSVLIMVSRLLPRGRFPVSASWLPLVSSALFQIAAIAGALLIVNECERRERRYKELHRALSDWEAELRAFQTWPPVIEVVTKIERALVVELLEWRSLLQNMKMPRN